MRFLLLTPGTGHFFCGSCLRDDSLGGALQDAGHQVVAAPLYLPFVLERDAVEQPVQMGGINLYLQQKAPLLGRMPRWLTDRLDHPGLLRWASKRGSMTDAARLGAMTLSMIRGEDGNQTRELDKLVSWAAGQPRPDVVVLSNIMLIGLARRLREALQRPVVVTMQGEQPFLDALPEPHRGEAWRELAARTAYVDRFVAVSQHYGDVVRGKLGLAAERVSVVHNGIPLAPFRDQPLPLAERQPRTIGYVARLCAEKGLSTLVDAFVQLAQRQEFGDVRLSLLGAMVEGDRELWQTLDARLRAAGCRDRVDLLANASQADKIAMLRRLRVLSVPATYGESFGLYLLEAMAAGVPVVQPRHGAFPEVLEATGGGILCAPDDPTALAQGLAELLRDVPRAQQLADRGRSAVLERFSADRMAEQFADACRMLLPV